jgi:hypothetical protein
VETGIVPFSFLAKKDYGGNDQYCFGEKKMMAQKPYVPKREPRLLGMYIPSSHESSVKVSVKVRL